MRNEELLINRYRVSVWEHENPAEDGGNSCTMKRMYFMSLNCTLRMLNVMLCTFYHYFKNTKAINRVLLTNHREASDTVYKIEMQPLLRSYDI